VLLLATLAAAAPAYVSPARLGVEAGVDLGWLLGGNGAGHRAGVGQSLGASLAMGTATALLIEVGHEHHVVADGSAFFMDLAAPSDSVQGGRDAVTFGAGGRIGVDAVDESSLPGGRLRVYPGAQATIGVYAWRARLATVGLDGAAVLDSSGVAPWMEVGVGAELRLGQRLSLRPHLDVGLVVARDDGERDGDESWGAEARIAPALDARVGF